MDFRHKPRSKYSTASFIVVAASVGYFYQRRYRLTDISSVKLVPSLHHAILYTETLQYLQSSILPWWARLGWSPWESSCYVRYWELALSCLILFLLMNLFKHFIFCITLKSGMQNCLVGMYRKYGMIADSNSFFRFSISIIEQLIRFRSFCWIYHFNTNS